MIVSPKWSPLRITILTPVLPSASDYLKACEQSINELTYTLGYYGIIVQWLICIDGPGAMVHEPLADQIVRLPTQQGSARARNSLIPFAKGEWVVPLNCDDHFDLKGMEAIGQRLIQEAEAIAWCATNRLLINGERTSHWNDTGRLFSPGELSQHWISPLPFSPELTRDSSHGAGGSGWLA